MSVIPTTFNEDLYKYLLANFSSEDEFLRNLKEEMSVKGMPQISISPEEATFLQFLVKLTGAKHILEIGSLGGYSAITMARALPADGKLTAIEINPDYTSFIRNKSRQAGLDHIIQVINEDAGLFLKTYESPVKFDIIFIDADKESYINYFNHAARLVRTGGIVAADNAFAFGELTNSSNGSDEVRHIREFNLYLKSRKDFSSCILPLGDGLALGLKTGNHI